MHRYAIALSLLICAPVVSRSASADPFIDTVFNVLDYGADPAASTSDTAAIQAALSDALSAKGVLFFPTGTWDLSTPLVITQRVEVRGLGAGSLLKYSGSGGAIQGLFTTAAAGEHTMIRDLQVRGTDAQGQSGVVMGANGIPPQMLTVRNLVTESFTNGYGIFLQTPIGAKVEQNRIGAARVGIALRSAAACLIAENFMSYWANYGIQLYSVAGDGVAARNNTVAQNVIHGTVPLPQDALQPRAAIRLQRVGSTSVQNNYIEGIFSPGGGLPGHGVWIDGTGGLTQSNRVVDTYFGPGTTGNAIRLESAGPVSHTTIAGNHLSQGMTIYDASLYTIFNFQYLSDMSQLLGTSTTRRGWIGLANSVVQLHP